MIALYLDEDTMSRALAAALKTRGIDVVIVADAGMRRHPDAEQLAFATSQGRVLFSYNVADFLRLHSLHRRRGSHHSGIVLVRQRRYSVGLKEEVRERVALV